MRSSYYIFFTVGVLVCVYDRGFLYLVTHLTLKQLCFGIAVTNQVC